MAQFYLSCSDASTSTNSMGAELTGGIAIAASKSLSKNPELISPFNLAYHLKTPGLVPIILGYPTPLFNVKGSKSDGFGKSASPVTPISPNKEQPNKKRKNVICGEPLDKDSFYLHTVNVTESKYHLDEFVVEVKEESQHTETKKPKFCTKQRIHLKFDTHTKSLKADSPILCTKTYKSKCWEQKVWVSCENSFNLFDFRNESTSTIYSSPIKEFCPIPYMYNEIAFIDEGDGHTFYGNMDKDNSFSRLKCKNALNFLATSDSPRILYGADDDEIILFDIRQSNTTSYSPIIQIKDLDPGKTQMYPCKYRGLISPREQKNHLITVTDKYHYIYDTRFMKQHLLRLTHNLLEGSDYIYFENQSLRYSKSDIEGRVYFLYQLDKNLDQGIYQSNLFFKEKERTFTTISTLSAMRKLNVMEDIYDNITRNKPQFYQELSQSITKLTKDVKAEGVCQVNLMQDGEDAFVFRLNDDGSVWYDHVAVNGTSVEFGEGTTPLDNCERYWNRQSFEQMKECLTDEVFGKKQLTQSTKVIGNDESLNSFSNTIFIKAFKELTESTIEYGINTELDNNTHSSNDPEQIAKNIQISQEFSSLLLERYKFNKNYIKCILEGDGSKIHISSKYQKRNE
uniref:Guanine nucleotide-binding protein subunit beta-like protein n=1 Tax=Rhabditophanes sp. KR3021 TaxID=114890 RepID=A0AC35U1F6_9BILA